MQVEVCADLHPFGEQFIEILSQEQLDSRSSCSGSNFVRRW